MRHTCIASRIASPDKLGALGTGEIGVDEGTVCTGMLNVEVVVEVVVDNEDGGDDAVIDGAVIDDGAGVVVMMVVFISSEGRV